MARSHNGPANGAHSLLPPQDEWVHLEKARNLFPDQPVIQTLRRWARVGVKTKAGFIRLRFFKSGRSKYTTRRWVEQFIQAQTMAATDTPAQKLTRDQSIRRQGLGTTPEGFDGEANEEGGSPISSRVPVRPVPQTGEDTGPVGGVLPVGAESDRGRRRRRAVLDRQRLDLSRLQDPPVGLPFSLS